MKKCTNCGTMCADDMNFCTECGHSLGSQSTTITRIVKHSIENKYIDQGFVPTNYMNWKRPRILHNIYYLCIIFAIGFGACSLLNVTDIFIHNTTVEKSDDRIDIDCEARLFRLYEVRARSFTMLSPSDYTTSSSLNSAIMDGKKYVEGKFKEECIEYAVCNLIGVGIWSLFAFLIYRPYPKKSTTPLSSIADYVERYMIFGLIYTKRHPKYVIYVKDNKYGILDATTYSFATKAKYDSLVWREEKGYLDAELDGSKMIIDVHDNCLK